MMHRQETVIEVRTYGARPGQRERLMAMMCELAFPVQRRLGMRVLGPFRSLDDQSTLVWLPAFPSGAGRDALKRALYEVQWSPKYQNLRSRLCVVGLVLASLLIAVRIYLMSIRAGA